MQDWITTETATADFGDERLDARYQVLLEQLSAKPSLSIPAACGGHNETTAAYRFFANDKTDAAKVLQPHRDATLQRVRAEKIVIAPQDTTELDLTRKHERVGGPLSDDKRWGLFVHPVLLMTPQRVPLGVIDPILWHRDAENLATSAQQRRQERRHKPMADKESYRWLRGYQTACDIASAAPDTQVISVSDSEGDIYECFVAGVAQRQGPRAAWVVRACQDRAVQEGGCLRQLLSCQKPLGHLTVRVGKREATTGPGRKRKQARVSRKATVTVRTVQTLLRPPQRPGQAKLPPVPVQAILAREEKPPQGEEPIEWLLITNLPAATFHEACKGIGYYCCRWEIEIYFRVLKGGCQVEELQFQDEERFAVCVALYLIVAWRVLYVLMLGRQCPAMRCDGVFTAAEWQSVYVIENNRPAPSIPPPLAEIIPLIARLGGYMGRKHDGPPGPKTMWIGLQRMRDFALAWEMFGPAASAKRCV
jgi:hypothetical protein